MQQMYQEIYETEDKELHRHNLIKKNGEKKKKSIFDADKRNLVQWLQKHRYYLPTQRAIEINLKNKI